MTGVGLRGAAGGIVRWVKDDLMYSGKKLKHTETVPFWACIAAVTVALGGAGAFSSLRRHWWLPGTTCGGKCEPEALRYASNIGGR